MSRSESWLIMFGCTRLEHHSCLGALRLANTRSVPVGREHADGGVGALRSAMLFAGIGSTARLDTHNPHSFTLTVRSEPTIHDAVASAGPPSAQPLRVHTWACRSLPAVRVKPRPKGPNPR